MKRLRLAILFLLIPICCVAFAALTKTTSIIELDAWQQVDAGDLGVGNAGNISDSYETLVYLVIAYTGAAAQDGVKVGFEVSYGDDDWTLLTRPFTTPAGAIQDTEDTDGGVTAGDTTITLSDASDFGTPGQKIFIQDSTPANSESVRIKSEAADVVTLCHDLLRNHADATSVWEFVHDYTIPIPAGFAFVRVLINNVDANADIFFTTRISKVTSLN